MSFKNKLLSLPAGGTGAPMSPAFAEGRLRHLFIMDRKDIPSWVKKALSMTEGSIRVQKHELEKRYVQYGILPEKLFWKEPDYTGFLLVPAKTIASMETKLRKEAEREQLIKACAERNNKGIALEKSGNIDEAVALYEENIKPGCYPAMHSFDRLLVIYRRDGDLKNELRVCKLAVSVFKGVNKYQDRLVKILAKINN